VLRVTAVSLVKDKFATAYFSLPDFIEVNFNSTLAEICTKSLEAVLRYNYL
jgi:hypothetical protein